MSGESPFTFKRDGVFVVAKERKEPEPRKYTNKQVVDMMHTGRERIKSYEDQIVQNEQAAEKAKEALVRLKDEVKELTEHYDWALQVQHSRLKALCEELHAEAVEKVESAYKEDPTLSTNSNKRQRFVQYRGYIATNPRVGEEIAADVLRDKLFENCELANPWPVTASNDD